MAEPEKQLIPPQELLGLPEAQVPETVKFYPPKIIGSVGEETRLQAIYLQDDPKPFFEIDFERNEEVVLACLSVPLNTHYSPSLVVIYKTDFGTQDVRNSKPLPKLATLSLPEATSQVLIRYH